MYSKLFSLALVGSALIAVDADARPRRVVVLEFDGPRRLADSGRSAVMSVLGEQYNIVATKSWDAARARAAGRGPQQWRQASKQAGVDAVIEGWVQPEGRHHVLTVAVREAATGRELDTLSVRIKAHGVTTEATHKLAAQLDDLLSWIDGDINAEPSSSLPDVRAIRPMLGARDPDRERRERQRLADDDEDEDELEEEEEEDRPRRKQRKRSRKVARTGDDRDTNDLVKLFGPESQEAAIVSEGRTVHTPKPTPRFQISGGAYVSARGMTFQYDPQAKGNPPEYPGQTLKGFAASAAVYPMPKQPQDGRLQGVGFSLGVSKSVLSVFTGADETGTGDYTMDHTAWEAGLHYRWPIELVSIDIDASLGNFSHRIVDLPESIQIPDTSYTYLGAGARLDLSVTDSATVGFGARYMYLLSAGDIADQDWYGAGKAWGAVLDGNFTIPVTGALFVRGAVEYRRVKIDLEGSGMLTQTWGVWDVVDSSVSGTANLGVRF